MNFNNILRGIITTVLGLILAIGAMYGYWQDMIEIWPEGCGIFAVALLLLLMPDDIRGFFLKIGNGLLAKFLPGSSDKTPPAA